MHTETTTVHVLARPTGIACLTVLYTQDHVRVAAETAAADQRTTIAMHVLKTLSVISMVCAPATKDGVDATAISTADTVENAATPVAALLITNVLNAQDRPLLALTDVKLPPVYTTVESTAMSITDLATVTVATTAVTAQDQTTVMLVETTQAMSTARAHVLTDMEAPVVIHIPDHATVAAPLVQDQMSATVTSASLTPTVIT